MQAAKILCLTVLGSCSLIASVGTTFPKRTLPKQRARIVNTEQMIFTSGGTIEVRDSFGDVKVEGWELPQVELTIIKTTHEEYSPEKMAEGIAELDRILIGTERPADDHLIITTARHSGKARRSPARKPDVEIEYRIRAPRQTRLIIQHDVGEVHVNAIEGDMNVTANVGDIAVEVPANARYAVDAQVMKHGEICSELEVPDGPAYAVRLRVGIGDISIHKLIDVEPETTVD